MQPQLALVQVDRRPREVRTPGELIPAVRRLVVERCDRLGDVVVTLPALSALRAAYPGARLALMVRAPIAPLAAMVQGVDDVLSIDGGTGAMRRALARFAPDLVVSVSRRPGAAWAAFRCRAPHRIGTGYRFHSPLFTRQVAERRRHGGRHEVEYALSFAHRAGACTGEAQFALRVPEQASASAAGWLEAVGVRTPFVLIHPGSGGSCPAWPAASWVELASALLGKGVAVVLSIGPADASVARAFDLGPAPSRELPRFTGGIEGLAALSRAAALVASNSTGPLHLAAALGTPTLGLYAAGPSCGPARWGPYAANGWALVAEGRQRGGEDTMAMLQVEAVVKQVRRLTALQA